MTRAAIYIAPKARAAGRSSWRGWTFALAIAAVLLTSGIARGKATNFTIRDLDGKYLRLSDFKSKAVYLTFWATWCKPCLSELKHLLKLYKKYRSRGFVILAISLDGPETRASVRATVQRLRLDFPVAIDTDSRVTKLYNPKRALPFSVLIRRGKVVKTRETFQVSDLPLIEKEIQQALR